MERRIMRRREPESTIHYLPEDLLLQIFSHFDDIDLKSMSLLCKQFCSLASPLVQVLSLRHSSLTYSDFERLFRRFPGVKEICIEFGKLDKPLMAISNSGLNLEELGLPQFSNVQYPKRHTIENMSTSRVIKSIKYLQLNRFHRRSKHLVIEFVNLFPSLTEFIFTEDILWNDEQIHKLTSKHPNLQKIDLISYNDVMTDKTLDILSSNCPKLETVNFEGCEEFTAEAMYKFFFNNPQLSSVAIPYFESPSISKVSKVVKGLQLLKNLNHLSLEYDIVQDAFLIGLAESRHQLNHLTIHSESKNYTMAGLSKLLSVYPDLESLVIHLPDSENCNNTHDADMSIIVKGLPKLKKIKLSSRRVVCQATLFSLVHNCPLLEKILLRRDWEPSVKQVYCDHDITRSSIKNYSIKWITIISPKDADAWLRSTVKSYCPNLRKQKYFID